MKIYTKTLRTLTKNDIMYIAELCRKGGTFMYNPQLETFLRVADAGSFKDRKSVV